MGTRLITDEQREVCARYGVAPVPADLHLKVGVAPNVRSGLQPMNGLRRAPDTEITGWYMWAGGELPTNDPEFFVPLHVVHLEEWCPAVLPYLALPRGWRFLI